MAMKRYCNSHLRSFQLMHKRCHIHEIKTEPFTYMAKPKEPCLEVEKKIGHWATNMF